MRLLVAREKCSNMCLYDTKPYKDPQEVELKLKNQ